MKESWHEGPNLLGVHLEGPFFSSKQCGAQDPRYLKPPTPEEYLPILEAGGGDIVRISLAPELNGALELGDILRSRGIIAAAGHSDATYSQVRDAVAHGFSHVTHLYSGMSALPKDTGHQRVTVGNEDLPGDGARSAFVQQDGSGLLPGLKHRLSGQALPVVGELEPGCAGVDRPADDGFALADNQLVLFCS